MLIHFPKYHIMVSNSAQINDAMGRDACWQGYSLISVFGGLFMYAFDWSAKGVIWLLRVGLLRIMRLENRGRLVCVMSGDLF